MHNAVAMCGLITVLPVAAIIFCQVLFLLWTNFLDNTPEVTGSAVMSTATNSKKLKRNHYQEGAAAAKRLRESKTPVDSREKRTENLGDRKYNTATGSETVQCHDDLDGPKHNDRRSQLTSIPNKQAVMKHKPTNLDNESHQNRNLTADKSQSDIRSAHYLPRAFPILDKESSFKYSGAREDKAPYELTTLLSPHRMSRGRSPSSAISPSSSFGSSMISDHRRSNMPDNRLVFKSGAVCNSKCAENIPISTASGHPSTKFPKVSCSKPDNSQFYCTNEILNTHSTAYVPGVDLLLDEIDAAQFDAISRFSRTPDSSPEETNPKCSSYPLGEVTRSSKLPPTNDSNVAVRPHSSAATSSLSARSAGVEMNKATKARYERLRQQLKRMQPIERPSLPALHLHLSKDGTSPLPPGWQRAPNTRRVSESASQENAEDGFGMYAYYYYHTRTRQTRWDPPVYPWDADPVDALPDQADVDDPEAPYNWGCASKFSVTHEEIEAMYCRIRQRMLERQCTDLLHELADRPDAPQGVTEQNFAIELFILVHNNLRPFRDARCKLGRIINDEDLYYLTRKLSEAVILKEVQKFHQAQAATSSSLFSAIPVPEVTPTVRARVSIYVRKYMEAKGAFYRRRIQQPAVPAPVHNHPRNDFAPHSKTDIDPLGQPIGSHPLGRPNPINVVHSGHDRQFPKVVDTQPNAVTGPIRR